MDQPLSVLLSHRSVEYYTPAWIITAACRVMGGIDLDPASCDEAQKTVQAKCFYTIDDNGLEQSWWSKVWLNPPYSKTSNRSNQEIWATKLEEEYDCGHVTEALLLVKAVPGYAWFEHLWDWWPVCFLRERVAFIGGNSQAKHGTAIFYFGANIMEFRDVFCQFGRVLSPVGGLK